MAAFRQRERMVERIDDEHARQEEIRRLAVMRLDLDELIGPADDALLPLGLLLLFIRIRHGERRERQERHASLLPALEIRDGRFGSSRISVTIFCWLPPSATSMAVI